ncbi:hypothetical protein L0222_26485 [bacterium]|nr:hypothetical protein [bacterium]MCI0605757.1 hypothetical protein [bacterium]
MKKNVIPIYLEDRQERILRKLSESEGTSISSVVRKAVDLMIQHLPVDKDPALRIVGLGSSRKKDLGVRHDEAIIQELEKEFRED